MPEVPMTIENSRRFFPLAVAGLSILALSGCATTAQYLQSDGKTPIERFEYDYVITPVGLNSAYEGQHCLEDTGFDPNYWDSHATSSANEEDGTITITASNGTVLKLKGLHQYKHTLEPVDAASQAIFNAYGCEVEDYSTVQ